MNEPQTERETIPVVEERATVRTRKRITGTIRARTVTHEHEQPISAELAVETLDVRRVPMDRFVDHPIPDRQEGDTTIISVIEEVATLTVRLKLVEEVRITRHTTTRAVNDAVTLRRQDVIVEREESPSDTEAS